MESSLTLETLLKVVILFILPLSVACIILFQKNRAKTERIDEFTLFINIIKKNIDLSDLDFKTTWVSKILHIDTAMDAASILRQYLELNTKNWSEDENDVVKVWIADLFVQEAKDKLLYVTTDGIAIHLQGIVCDLKSLVGITQGPYSKNGTVVQIKNIVLEKIFQLEGFDFGLLRSLKLAKGSETKPSANAFEVLRFLNTQYETLEKFQTFSPLGNDRREKILEKYKLLLQEASERNAIEVVSEWIERGGKAANEVKIKQAPA